MCVSLRRCDLVVKVSENGHREVKNICSGNNGCHMLQVNVIKFWVALNFSFPDSCSVCRFPEKAFFQFR